VDETGEVLASVAVLLAAEDTPTSVLDPTIQVLLTIFGGALIAAVAGLLGAMLQGRREHKRWLRERRFEAFVRAFALLKAFDLNASKQKRIAAAMRADSETADADALRIEQLQTEADQLYTSVAAELAPIIVLGPNAVTERALEIQFAYEANDKTARGRAEAAFIEAAQRVLKVPTPERLSADASTK
jgi:hypothetical protein